MAIAPLPNIADRIAQSHETFMMSVWPAISHAFGDGQLIPVEGRPDDAARCLDFSGIDCIFNPSDGEPYGVSQRVLAGSWRNLTMNTREYTRLSSVWGRSGAIVPSVLVQAYVNSRLHGAKRLDSAIVLRTEDFLQYSLGHPGTTRENHGTGRTFHLWGFDELTNAGVSLLTLPMAALRDPLGPQPVRHPELPTAG